MDRQNSLLLADSARWACWADIADSARSADSAFQKPWMPYHPLQLPTLLPYSAWGRVASSSREGARLNCTIVVALVDGWCWGFGKLLKSFPAFKNHQAFTDTAVRASAWNLWQEHQRCGAQQEEVGDVEVVKSYLDSIRITEISGKRLLELSGCL